MSTPKTIIYMNDDTRLALLEQTIGHINLTLLEIKAENKNFRLEMNQKFNKIDDRFDKIDNRFDKIDSKFLNVENKFQRIESKIDDNFRWTMGVVITLFSGLYATALGGMIARLCHWI